MPKKLDDATGARGDVAPPAVHMPRANGHSGVPGGFQPPPPPGHTPWEAPSRCDACGVDATLADIQAGSCRMCGCAMSALHPADTDGHTGTIPAVQNKVGAPYQAPPPPGAPLRMGKGPKK